MRKCVSDGIGWRGHLGLVKITDTREPPGGQKKSASFIIITRDEFAGKKEESCFVLPTICVLLPVHIQTGRGVKYCRWKH